MSLSFRHAAFAAVPFFVAFTAHAKTASEIYEQASRSTVVVENINDKGEITGFGSGVVLPNGSVVTNCHVIKDASQLKVRSNKNKFPAVLQFSDLDRDVCSLFIVGLNAPAVVVGSTKILKVGAKVFAIGAPKGLELTLSDGIVSSLREGEGNPYRGHIQITAAISPGSSGGGLFDENGALVGLTTFFITEGQNLNFAVPVEWVTELPIRSANASALALSLTQQLNKADDLMNRKDWPALLKHSLRWTKAQPGSDIAWCWLGVAYGNLNQFAKAVEAHQKALRINPEYAKAQFDLGFLIFNGQGIAQDHAEGIKWWRLAAARGYETAQGFLGITYHKGYGVVQDYAEAVKWYRLSAAQGDATSQNNLGNMYANGQGVTQDYAEAVKWHRLAAAQGDANAQFNLGLTYANGQGVARNDAEAVKWYRLSAAQGDAEAQFNLGYMYHDGKGVTQDYVEAMKWYRLAAVQGLAGAQFNLGLMYKKGQGVTQDYTEAVKWHRLSAVQGEAHAQFNLGVMYDNGQGVAQDYVRAHMWLNLGAKSGDADAAKNRDIVARKMTSQQIAQAQIMARDCQQKQFKGCE